MKISNIIFSSSLVLFSSCAGNQSNNHEHTHDIEEHVHEHGAGENHEHSTQEEFTLAADTSAINESTHHSHSDGNTHQDH